MVLLDSLEPLVTALRDTGRRVIGPTVRDGAVVLAELRSAAELPYGWGVAVGPGTTRLRRRGDRAAFAHAASPHSWKAWLHPSSVRLWTARRDGDGDYRVSEPAPPTDRYAFLGVRACDLRAIAAQERVLAGGRFPDRRFADRWRDAFVVAVHCTEPAGTCFCVSAGGGPRAQGPYDIALTELVEDGAVRYLAEAGSPAGERLLAAVAHEEADAGTAARADAAVEAARDRMGRALPPVDLRELMAAGAESPVWDDIAQRCLSCGNCTMVCPTCFCTTVTDTTDVTGDVAERWQRWDSCFDTAFSELHGGPVRASTRSRYRQWLTHKFGTWHDQFGGAGCVGCGRCVVWCPVGIDVTAELHALAATAAAPDAPEAAGATDAPGATDTTGATEAAS